MDIDPRMLPDPQEGGDETPKNESQAPIEEKEPKIDEELESLKTKNIELQKQKEHWREKYERDINKPVASEELDDDMLSDEGKMLKAELNAMKAKLTSYEKDKEEQAIYSSFPSLKDKKDEFKEFVDDPDNSGIKLEKLAKLFLVENGMSSEVKPRKGLEKPTGGQKANFKSGYSQDEIKRLRENQPRRYQQMIQSGKINPDDIS